MRPAFLLIAGALAPAACVAPAPSPRPAPAAQVDASLSSLPGGGVSVARTAAPAYAMWDGAAARRDADALCGPRGVRGSIYDRYQAPAWIFVGGCA